MGWFDGVSLIGGDRHHHRRSSGSSSKKHHSSTGSVFGLGDDHRSSKKNHSSSRSIFGLGDDHRSSSHHNRSTSSFFGFGGRSSSYYKRSPRKGYLNKILYQLRRLWRDLIYYARKNPFKVFMLVIMPLITGGALTGLLARFGVRLPRGLESMIRGMGGHAGGVGIGRGRNGSMQFEREKYQGPLSGVGAAMGAMGGAGGLMSVAKMFL